MSQDGRWGGGLEIMAAARHYTVAVVVVPERSDMQPCVFHADPQRRRIVLWYRANHFEWLRPEAPGDYPAVISDITTRAKPEDVGRGGVVSYVSGTRFTASSGGRAGDT
eukprot:2313368-Heterocapsa_arctica.AAC.1